MLGEQFSFGVGSIRSPQAIEQYKKAAFDPKYELWQAGKGVDAIDRVESCAEVLARFGEVARMDDSDIQI